MKDNVVNGAKAIGKFVVDHRGVIASVAATGFCLIPAVGWGACAIAGGIALGVRVEQRIRENGFSESLRSNLGDAGLTYITMGLSGAFSALGEELSGPGAKVLEYVSRLIPSGYDTSATLGESDPEPVRRCP